MTPLTALDVPGDVYSFEGEIDSRYVHQYKTTRYPELDGQEIEERFESFEEVSMAEVSEASENTPQWDVEVYCDDRDIIREAQYQEIVEKTRINQTS